MKEICIPFTYICDNEHAEVEVRVPGTGKIWKYRVEPLQLAAEPEASSMDSGRINGLKRFISNYSKNWELIQIIGANENSGNIHMLYREKQSPVATL
jgi:hypothetical protein